MTARFDEEADLIVVGFGAAGAATALRASERGASVILVEKQAEDRHTSNTRMSGGLLMTVNDVDAATEYLKFCCGGMVPDAPLRALAERASTLKPWLEELAPNLGLKRVNGAEHPDFPGAHGIDAYQGGNPRVRIDPAVKSGLMLDDALKSALAKTKVDIRWSSPAQRLVRDEGGHVRSIIVETPIGPRTLRGRNGIVLTTGGFEYDEAAKLNYLRTYPMYYYGSPANTGDGIRMAQEVGADLWHMNQSVGRGIANFKLKDGSDLGFFISINPPGYVITDRFGRRFANEESQAKLQHSFYFDLLVFDPDRGVYPRVPCYWFFDETRRKAGPLANLNLGAHVVGLYEWSSDNSQEVESGWIAKGNTIFEAAKAAGLDDPEAAARSVEDYNATCRNGAADPFGRAKETLVPIAAPPYYCVKLWPGGSNTTGGPRRDEHARVLNAFGAPIPGLFAAGELGQVSGLIYPADGFNLTEAICYGQIAAETALSNRKLEALPGTHEDPRATAR